MTDNSLPRLIVRMDENERKQFIQKALNGQVFTSLHLRENEQRLLNQVFMPIAFGALGIYDEENLRDNFGIFWEDISKAGPSSINGYPCFFSMNIMHKKDWDICWEVIQDMQKKLENIEAKDKELEAFIKPLEEMFFEEKE